MPNRILREGILSSERVEKLNWAEEVFLRRLMSVVDDFGRYYARPALLRAACYPLLLSKVSELDVEKWLAASVSAGLVKTYQGPDEKRYLSILSFKQQIRSIASKYPDEDLPATLLAQQLRSSCVADEQQLKSFAHLDVSVSEDVSVSVSEPAPKEASKFPEFWSVWPKNKRKGGITECEKHWKQNRLNYQAEEIIAHVMAMAAHDDWIKQDGQFVPAPIAYLRGKRWEGAEIDAPRSKWVGIL